MKGRNFVSKVFELIVTGRKGRTQAVDKACAEAMRLKIICYI